MGERPNQELVVIEGIRHYDIYKPGPAFERSVAEALEWYGTYL